MARRKGRAARLHKVVRVNAQQRTSCDTSDGGTHTTPRRCDDRPGCAAQRARRGTMKKYLDRPSEFLLDQIVLSDGRKLGDAVDADPWLPLDVVAPLLARDENGTPRYRLVYLELPRGHAKTSMLAAAALTEAILHRSTDVVFAAADEDQAAIALDQIKGFLARNPLLASAVEPL